ncbi:hypothetical protein, partial [Salmonella enterica]|uniref:hypothetical protein n=1 Tax=Salmonella enterica TaxID=28901 RepID=UPI00398C76BD
TVKRGGERILRVRCVKEGETALLSPRTTLVGVLGVDRRSGFMASLAERKVTGMGMEWRQGKTMNKKVKLAGARRTAGWL